jgi:hypothetical protein
MASRVCVGLGVALLLCVASRRFGLEYPAGWFSACFWLLITKQWRVA